MTELNKIICQNNKLFIFLLSQKKTTKLILLDSLIKEKKIIENDFFNRIMSSSLKISFLKIG